MRYGVRNRTKNTRLVSRLCCILALWAGLCTGAFAGLSETQIQAIDNIVTQALQEGPYPAMVILVNQGGKTVYASARGYTDLENEVTATLDSVFAMGSITKSFTALATLQLVENGALNLDDTVSEILPDYQGPGSGVTVRQLLTHTSGIPNYLGEIPTDRSIFERGQLSREQMIALFSSEPLLFEPGSEWSYSNSGYYLLGIMIEKVSGQDYYHYLQQYIFEPMGLHSTYSGDDSELVPHRAHGYVYSDGQYRNAPPWYYLVPFSAGSLLTTVGDLITYRRAVFNTDAISKDLLSLVTRTSELSDGTEIQYTLGGLISSDFGGHPKYSHSGEIFGYFSNHSYYPDDDLSIVVLANSRSNSTTPVWMERKMARVVLNMAAAPEGEAIVLPTASLERYAGDFQLGVIHFGPKKYGFTAHDDQLFLVFGGLESGGSEIPLQAHGNGLFVMDKNDEWTFQFQDEGDLSPGFRMQVRDASITLERVKP